MTPKQEAYARGVLFGRKTKRQAYRDAYPASEKWKDSSVDQAVNKLEKNTNFLLRFEKLRQEAEQAMNITRDTVLMELCKVGFSDEDSNIKTRDKLTALGMIVDILGYKNAQKVDMTVSGGPQVNIEFPDDGRGGYE